MKFSELLKVEAITMVIKEGAGIRQAANELGIAMSTLQRWLAEYRRSESKRGPQVAFGHELLALNGPCQ